MGERLRGVVPAAAGFCLYRSAATFAYNSGMGMHQSSVGFVSDLSFVLAMNVCACSFAVVLLLMWRTHRVPWWGASPWLAFGLIAVGMAMGQLAPVLGDAAATAVSYGVAGLCGVALTMLSVVWIDFFVAQDDAGRVFLQVVLGYTLYTMVTCLYSVVPHNAAMMVSLVCLGASAVIVQRLGVRQNRSLERVGTFPLLRNYSELPTYVCFFVLVGVVGIMHTSVIGSSAEYVIAVPMWTTRVISLAVFLLVVVFMGQSLSAVFKWVFPILIIVLTLLPFLGGTLGSVTGLVSIVAYNVCGMVFYLFIIREGRRLDLSAALMAAVYMLGSSGTLLVGLAIGLVLSAVSASFDLSLLTVVAFAAMYPLALVLMLLMRRERGSMAATEPHEASPAEGERQRAVATVAERHGLTRREREVLGYLAAGRSVKYVAETLVISENTAWTHAKRIYAKTGTHGRQELMDLVEKAG